MKEGQKQEPVGGIVAIRNWIRTNGEMSEDGKTITYNCEELESVIAQQLATPPPSPVGIDVEGLIKQVGYIKRNAEKINEHTWKVYTEQILMHIEEIEAGYSSLPQSSTEEEKDLWNEVGASIYDYPTFKFNEGRVNKLLSTYKIYKR